MEFNNSDRQTVVDSDYIVNITCDYDYVPPAYEYIERLGTFGAVFVSLGTILMAATFYLAIDASYKVLFSKENKSVKRNVVFIIFVYPIASLCSLVALSTPRAQLLSEAVIQIYLTIAFCRLYLLIIDVGLREEKKPPTLKLRVGPCCCWPCLPFPDLLMNSTHLSWIQIIVLQLPIVQTLIYCVFVFMSVEDPLLATKYGVFLQPLSLTSILLGLYGLSIAVKTLQEVKPDLKLHHKALLLQLVFLFSKLQGFIVKNLSGTGLFPCNPPITPQIYCNITYNAVMLIEMLFLCYAARLVYAKNPHSKANSEGGFAGVTMPENNSPGNGEVRPQNDIKTPGTRTHQERYTNATNNNENC